MSEIFYTKEIDYLCRMPGVINTPYSGLESLWKQGTDIEDNQALLSFIFDSKDPKKVFGYLDKLDGKQDGLIQEKAFRELAKKDGNKDDLCSWDFNEAYKACGLWTKEWQDKTIGTCRSKPAIKEDNLNLIRTDYNLDGTDTTSSQYVNDHPTLEIGNLKIKNIKYPDKITVTKKGDEILDVKIHKDLSNVNPILESLEVKGQKPKYNEIISEIQCNDIDILSREHYKADKNKYTLDKVDILDGDSKGTYIYNSKNGFFTKDNKQFIYIRKDAKMVPAEPVLKNIGQAKKLIQKYGPEFEKEYKVSGLMDGLKNYNIKALNILDPDDQYTDLADCQAFCDSNNKIIGINLNECYDKSPQQLAGTLIHELTHSINGESDSIQEEKDCEKTAYNFRKFTKTIDEEAKLDYAYYASGEFAKDEDYKGLPARSPGHGLPLIFRTLFKIRK